MRDIWLAVVAIILSMGVATGGMWYLAENNRPLVGVELARASLAEVPEERYDAAPAECDYVTLYDDVQVAKRQIVSLCLALDTLIKEWPGKREQLPQVPGGCVWSKPGSVRDWKKGGW